MELASNFFIYLPSMYWMIGVALVVKPIVFHFFGLYKRIWVYASVHELKVILAAVTTSSVFVSGVMIILFTTGAFYAFPRLVLVIDWLITLFAIGGLRLAPRLIAESQQSGASARSDPNVRKALVVGAGDAGALVVRELQKNTQLNLVPVGFLDDNESKQNQQIHGVPVVGALVDLEQVMNQQKIDEVIIAIPSAPGKVVRLVADVCRRKAVPFRTMPGIYELLGGKVSINRLREVDIADLLQREAVKTNDELVGVTLSSKVVMVTGAGGSIGRELCRQISRWAPADLILLGHGENSIFESYLELQETFPSQVIRPVIVDVRDKSRLEQIFQRYHPQVVFHAAAHKHVPLMDVIVEDAISNNVSGTRNLVECCLAYDVDRLVMISTDKAIRPANVMGATKRIAEMVVLEAARTSGKAYSVVRFGNVLGSRGSVVPLFKRQIARGGPVLVTHPDMKRYFMTIPEAVYLVLQSASMGKGGETFVLNMGQQVRILDLAEDLIKLSGLEPYKDIEIEFSGIRPGEKLSEDLWEEGYVYEPTAHPEIFRLESQENLQNGPLDEFIGHLVQLSKDGRSDEVIRVLDETIPGSSIRCNPPPEINSVI
ncbi:MAG: polysaccharide biosynthesis protein [Anaerolineaceae bacterium]|nr:polysaccharide biosynthesis protein [Anaerolineaceae bacterium]